MSIQINQPAPTAVRAEVVNFNMNKDLNGSWIGTIKFQTYDADNNPLSTSSKIISPKDWNDFWTNFNSFDFLEQQYAKDATVTTEDAINVV